MTAHHPWLKISHEKVRDKLDAVSVDAAFLWYSTQMYLAASGGDGTILMSKLPLSTARRFTAARIRPLVAELVAEGLMEQKDALTVAVKPWEQPPVDTWTDETKRMRWQRAKELQRDGELRRRIKDRDRNLCRYCGVRVNWSDKKSKIGATYDHVDPDGINSLDNVVVACRGCNGKKRDRTPEQAGMSLLRVGQTARPDAASAAHGRSPKHRDEEPDPVPIQIGFESDSNHGPDPPCAPTRDRTDPNRIWIGSESGQTVEGPGTGAHAHENVGGGDVG